jgi:hypothetical protein
VEEWAEEWCRRHSLTLSYIFYNCCLLTIIKSLRYNLSLLSQPFYCIFLFTWAHMLAAPYTLYIHPSSFPCFDSFFLGSLRNNCWGDRLRWLCGFGFQCTFGSTPLNIACECTLLQRIEWTHAWDALFLLYLHSKSTLRFVAWESQDIALLAILSHKPIVFPSISQISSCLRSNSFHWVALSSWIEVNLNNLRIHPRDQRIWAWLLWRARAKLFFNYNG